MNSSALTVAPWIVTDLPYDTAKDLSAVIPLGKNGNVLVVNPAKGWKTVQDLVAAAKANPGTINYGSAGIGTSTHLAGAYFAAQTKIDIVHVPYTVSTNIISDMLSGAIQASFDPLAFVLSFLQNGSLRALAIGADEPLTEPLKIPTAASQGVDYNYATWYGILAPAKTPKPVLKTLADAIAKASQDPDLQQKIKAQGIRPENTALDAFDTYVDNDVARLSPLIKGIGVKQ